jgi:hypothetical protein
MNARRVAWLLVAAVAVIAFGAIWPVLLASVHGFSSVPLELANVSQVLGFGRWDFLRKIAFPSALPDIVAVVRGFWPFLDQERRARQTVASGAYTAEDYSRRFLYTNPGPEEWQRRLGTIGYRLDRVITGPDENRRLGRFLRALIGTSYRNVMKHAAAMFMFFVGTTPRTAESMLWSAEIPRKVQRDPSSSNSLFNWSESEGWRMMGESAGPGTVSAFAFYPELTKQSLSFTDAGASASRLARSACERRFVDAADLSARVM